MVAMKNAVKRAVFGLMIVSLGGVALGPVGCASATNASEDTFSYLHGDQHATFGATPSQVVDAAIAAAGELSLPVDSHSADGLIGDVKMHETDGTVVEVRIKGNGSDKSEVSVRVGTWGDRTLQQRVLDKLSAHLTATPVVKTTMAQPSAPSSPPQSSSALSSPAPSAAPALAPPAGASTQSVGF